MKKHVIILSVIYFVTLSFAQAPDICWTQIYGGNRVDVGCSVEKTYDGGYIIAGYTSSFSTGDYNVWLLKTDANGDTLWTKVFGRQYNDWGLSVQQTSDSGYIIAGATEYFGGDYDVWLLKTDANGDTLWTRTYGVTVEDWAYSVQQTSDGGYVIAGRAGTFVSGDGDVYVIKTDANGYLVWYRTMGGPETDEAFAVRQTLDDGYIIAGYKKLGSPYDHEVYLVKLNADGDSIWAKTYGRTGKQQARALQLTSDNGYIIAGLDQQGDHSVYLLKTDSIGDSLWAKRYKPSEWVSAIGTAVQETSDSGFIIVGYTHPLDAGYGDIYLVKTSANGDSLWAKRYGGTSRDRGHSVQVTAYGNYVIAGQTESFGADTMDVCLLKTNPVNYLQLITPNGGEAWPGGTTIGIVWWCQNPLIGDVCHLLFSTDGGSSYPDTIAANIPTDSTSWTWILPSIIDSTCRVKIQILDSLDVIIAADASDTNFAILESTPPIPFSLISPPDSSILPIARPTFVWESSFDSASGLQNYEVYIDDTLQHTGIDTTWLVDYDLQEDYNAWFVVAYDSAGNSRQSNETWTVLIDTTPPSAVDLIAPPNYSYLNDSTVNFIWHEAYDNFSGIDYYLLQFALDSAFSQSLVETTLVDTILTTTLSDTIYYWRVKAFDVATNEGEFSSIWRFGIGTDSTAPTAPTLLSPINGIILNDTLVTFEWTVVTNLTSISNHSKRKDIKSLTLLPEVLFAPIRYIIQIDTLLNFVTPMIIDTVDTSSTTAYLHENFPFYWRVKAYDWAGNQGSYASPDSFGIDVGPVIESTTVWIDTSYAGPFEIFTKVTDNLSGVDSVILYYQRDEDPDWISSPMSLTGMPNWYLDSIPEVDTLTDTVRYYIEAVDNSGNTATDPAGAPADCYTFIANYYPGILDIQTIPKFFSFGLKTNPARNKALFRISIPGEAIITLRIYDVCGRLIAEPISGRKSAGIHEIQWTTNTSAAGIYFYALESPWQKKVGKFVIVK